MDLSKKLGDFAAQKGLSGADFLDKLHAEFIGPSARWFLARFAISGKHLHWPSLFLLSAWYGWRKMYVKSATSGFWFGCAVGLWSVAALWVSGHFHSWAAPAWLIWLACLIGGALEVSQETVENYKQFVHRKVIRIVDSSTTPDHAINRSTIEGGTNMFGLLVPIIPAWIGLCLGLFLAGTVSRVLTTSNRKPPLRTNAF
jgi:hypothetical protein